MPRCGRSSIRRGDSSHRRQTEIEDKKKAVAEAEQRLASMQVEIARQKQAGPQVDPARLAAIEADLEKRNAELARQKQDIIRLEGEVSGYKTKVAKLETRPEPLKPIVAVAAPSIQIIDPQIVVTRDSATVKVRAGLRTRDIVGRVTSPAGLMSLTANDVAQAVDANGMFKTSVDLAAGKTRVTMLAVDRQGKTSRLEFFLEEDLAAARPAVAVPPRIPSLNAGNYYALLIGNQKYEKLPAIEYAGSGRLGHRADPARPLRLQRQGTAQCHALRDIDRIEQAARQADRKRQSADLLRRPRRARPRQRHRELAADRRGTLQQRQLDFELESHRDPERHGGQARPGGGRFVLFGRSDTLVNRSARDGPDRRGESRIG